MEHATPTVLKIFSYEFETRLLNIHRKKIATMVLKAHQYPLPGSIQKDKQK